MKIDKWVDETVSSRKALGDRKLGELLEKLGRGDTVVVSEISRLGRNLMQIMGILNFCMERLVKIIAHQGKLRAWRQHKFQGSGVCVRPVGGDRAQLDIPAHQGGARPPQGRRAAARQAEGKQRQEVEALRQRRTDRKLYPRGPEQVENLPQAQCVQQDALDIFGQERRSGKALVALPRLSGFLNLFLTFAAAFNH